MGIWIQAILSGLFVVLGVTFVGVVLPFAFGLVPLGVGLFWLNLPISLTLGIWLGIINARKTLRHRVRRPGDPASGDR